MSWTHIFIASILGGLAAVAVDFHSYGWATALISSMLLTLFDSLICAIKEASDVG